VGRGLRLPQCHVRFGAHRVMKGSLQSLVGCRRIAKFLVVALGELDGLWTGNRCINRFRHCLYFSFLCRRVLDFSQWSTIQKSACFRIEWLPVERRILEWVAYPFSSGCSQPRNWTGVSCIAGAFFTSWATREALIIGYLYIILIILLIFINKISWKIFFLFYVHT